MPSIDHSTDDEAGGGTLNTIVPQRPQSTSSRPMSRTSRSQSREHTSDDGPPKSVHRPSMVSLFSDDEDDSYLPSARKGLQDVETETVNSIALLDVPNEGSLRVKKSTDYMASTNGSNHASLQGSKAPAKIRRKRLAAASRADIFAAKIASAMDEAASSDSDETFVYGTANRDTFNRPYNLRTSSTMSLPVSPRVKPGQGNRHNSNLLIQTNVNSGPPTVSYPSPQNGKLEQEDRGRKHGRTQEWSQATRQGTSLYNSIKAKNVYLNRWRGGDLEDDEDDEDPGPLIDENTPLTQVARSQQYVAPTPHDYGANRRPATLYIRLTLWAVGISMCAMFCAFVIGILVASSKPLVHVQVARLVDVFPSDIELVLSIIVQAKNPGCFTVGSSAVDLDLFATSKYTVEDLSKRTVLLGNVQELDSPLIFPGSFFNPKSAFSMSTMRLVSPCGNATDLWQQISTNTFELTVRGVLKYSLVFSQDLRTPLSSSIVVTPE